MLAVQDEVAELSGFRALHLGRSTVELFLLMLDEMLEGEVPGPGLVQFVRDSLWMSTHSMDLEEELERCTAEVGTHS